MAVFWIAVTSHCLLEVLPQLSFLACETEDTSGHCDDTTCEYVEAGNYKISKQVVYTPPVFSLLLTCIVPLTEDSQLGKTTVDCPLSIPFRLQKTWQFSFRTALPIRAPSSLS